MMSGTTPSCSSARQVPQRPVPHITSSAIMQHAVAVADLAHGAGIARRRRHRAAGRADHRLEDEGGDVLGADTQDLLLQLVGAGARDIV